MNLDFLPDWAIPLGVALIIGLLVGLEKESIPSESGKHFGGVRTFPLIVLGGFASAFWWPGQPVFIIGLGILGVLLAASYIRASFLTGATGITTESAAVLCWLLGGMTAQGQLLAAMVIAVITTLLLAAKQPMHSFVQHYVQATEMLAVAKFALLALVIYPLLPDQGFTRLDINPREIWLMVVLVSGLSFVGYVGVKIYGPKRGLLMTALFGGMISSTAVALTFARIGVSRPQLASSLAGGIILASAIMFVRQLIEIAIVDKSLLAPVAIVLLPAFVIGIWFFMRNEKEPTAVELPLSNPFELTTALQFGALYGILVALSQLALEYFGSFGVFALALLSGIADVDAITLSLTQLHRDGSIPAALAVSGIVIAAVSNTLVKVGITWAVGTREVAIRVSVALGAVAAFTLAAIGAYLAWQS